MKSNSKLLREAIRKYAQRLVKENKQADAEWITNKIITALDAATNNKKDYQLAAAYDSDEFKKLAQDIDSKKSTDQDMQLKETFFDWLARGAQRYVSVSIDRRAGYLMQATKEDPKLQRMAREAGLSPADLEKKIYGMMGRDRDFLRSIVNQRWR